MLEDETVILDMESGVYSGLNEEGTVEWTLLESQTTFAEMLKTLQEKIFTRNKHSPLPKLPNC